VVIILGVASLFKSPASEVFCICSSLCLDLRMSASRTFHDWLQAMRQWSAAGLFQFSVEIWTGGFVVNAAYRINIFVPMRMRALECLVSPLQHSASSEYSGTAIIMVLCLERLER
jgi:hypothetical protein